MPYFCNNCQDVVELRRSALDIKRMLVAGLVVGVVLGLLVGAIASAIFGLSSGFEAGGVAGAIFFVIGLGAYYWSWSNQTPFCATCRAVNYYAIAPHEAATLQHAKRAREELRQHHDQLMQAQYGVARMVIGSQAVTAAARTPVLTRVQRGMLGASNGPPPEVTCKNCGRTFIAGSHARCLGCGQPLG